jgi:allantoicase
MDGWESRRRREAGHDWCIMKLGLAGVIRGFEVNTAFFTGNQVPRVMIQAACLDKDIDVLPEWNHKPRKGTKASPEEHAAIAKIKSEEWETVLPMRVLQPGWADCCKHYFAVDSNKRWTHLRINYLPDGGIARIRCHGEVLVDWAALNVKAQNQPIDLLSAANGGLGLMASNSHYGTPQLLLGPGRGVNMGDGWETARNPNRPPMFKTDANGMMELPGFDWCCLQLGSPGIPEMIEIDTIHFKGNYPESFMAEGCYSPQATRTTYLSLSIPHLTTLSVSLH